MAPKALSGRRPQAAYERGYGGSDLIGANFPDKMGAL